VVWAVGKPNAVNNYLKLFSFIEILLPSHSNQYIFTVLMTMAIAPRRLRSSTNGSFSKQVQMSVVALAIFLLGCAVGSYSQTNTETRSLDSLGLLNFEVPSADCEKTSPQKTVENNEGWKSIEVFYGSTQEHKNKRRKWFSQTNQDQVVIGLLRNKREGFFIDLAANDAQKYSNTYALERRFGWEGICIEPNPEYWFDLSRFRTCKVVAAIVGRDRMEEIKFNYRGVFGGINRGEEFDNGEEYAKVSIPAFTVPLEEILERTDTPHVIDYLSLDVEGAETYIIKNFPLSSYQIKIMTVERPDEELQQHLKANGFKLMGDISDFGESLWIHNDFMNGLDLSVLHKKIVKKQRLSLVNH
jgi:hypothetical protein